MEASRNFDFADVLTRMAEERASDVHLSPGFAPAIRVRGRIVPLDEYGKLSPQQTRDTVYSMLNDDQRKRFESSKQLDLAYAVPGVARFRVNCFFQRGSISAAFRRIPHEIPELAELGLPQVLREMTLKPRGFVLVTGPTGSGKSTTLASMIDKINTEHRSHIITIEDPIEYLHPHINCTINQREVGFDTQTFALALRAALRQAPKVILVGEMRDVETISIALEASETGHLVLSTLHTIDASKTIDRIVGVFPKNEERQIRTRFSQSFKWIVSQRLVPKEGGGRKAICEILRSNSRTREYIQEGEREGKSLMDAIEDGGLDGMQSFDQELEKCINSGELDREIALSYATNRTNLQLRLDTQGAGVDEKVKGTVKMATPAPAPRRPAPPSSPASGPRRSDSEFEDLIER
jgi:twitching motility protein PilT